MTQYLGPKIGHFFKKSTESLNQLISCRIQFFHGLRLFLSRKNVLFSPEEMIFHQEKKKVHFTPKLL